MHQYFELNEVFIVVKMGRFHIFLIIFPWDLQFGSGLMNTGFRHGKKHVFLYHRSIMGFMDGLRVSEVDQLFYSSNSKYGFLKGKLWVYHLSFC